MAGVWGYAANMTGLTLGGGGFVFQDFNLLDTFNLQDNIFLPLVLANTNYTYIGLFLSGIITYYGFFHTKP